LAVHGVTAPFACEGTFVPDGPVSIVFKDGNRFKIIGAQDAYEQERKIVPLLDYCKPAPFGEGKKTRYDRAVRDAYQLQAENGRFSVENFDPESAGILKTIQRELAPHDPKPISAELYTMNVYTRGGHFAPHKDTPRGADMFGTLVVCLPSQFNGGNLVLSHRGIAQSYEWGSAIQKQKNPNQLHWAAFFGDVDHQIERVWSGARVTLTYLLRRGNDDAPSRDIAGEQLTPRIHEAWRALLADESFLPQGGTLGYPCCHLYHQDARFQSKQSPNSVETATMLKGRDHLVAASALEAGLSVTFNPYMFETCVDETWQLDRFPTTAEKNKLRRQMDTAKLQKTLPIRGNSQKKADFGLTWLEPPPTSNKTSRRTEDDGESGLPAAAILHSCEYCPWGYFGNEGSDVDLYTYAALHIAIPPMKGGIRRANESSTLTSVKPARAARSSRKRSPKQELP
jgi:hypothetical protein